MDPLFQQVPLFLLKSFPRVALFLNDLYRKEPSGQWEKMEIPSNLLFDSYFLLLVFSFAALREGFYFRGK